MQVVSSKKIKTRKKNIMNVDEMNAYKVAYGQPLKAKDYLFYIGIPALAFALVSFIILFYWQVSLIASVFGALYGAKVFLPKSIERSYQEQAFMQRSKFINNMTQILTDESKTVSRALESAKERANGEFQEDISRLQAILFGADFDQIRRGFKILATKYEDDIIFTQYLEQLETAMVEGRANIDTLKDIKTYHNDMKKKQAEYKTQKLSHLMGMKVICNTSLFFIAALIFAGSVTVGFKEYIAMYPHHPTGWISGGIYMLILAYHFRKFSTYFFDESVLEVQL